MSKDVDSRTKDKVIEPAEVRPRAPIEAEYISEEVGGDGDTENAYLEDGDGIERKVWVIEAGASDPEGAEPEDLIFEEEDES